MITKNRKWRFIIFSVLSGVSKINKCRITFFSLFLELIINNSKTLINL